jgi:putative aldouronate transport system permease protein
MNSLTRSPRAYKTLFSQMPSQTSKLAALRSYKVQRNLAWIWMILPAVAHVFLFSYVTMFGILIAFENYKPLGGWKSFFPGLAKTTWAGLDNFKYLWALREKLVLVVRNTVVMNLLFIAFGMITSIAIAIMVFEIYKSTISRFYQTAMILPSLFSIVIVAYFANLFLEQAGLLNQARASLGLAAIKWYQRPEYWPVILLVVKMWAGAGIGSVLYVSFLLGIDPQLFEAAKVDGANKWQEIRYITLPMLTPVISFVFIMSMAGIVFGDFGLFYIVTQDSASLRSFTEVVDTFVYRTLRSTTAVSGGPSKAAAAGLLQSVVGMTMIIMANAIIKRIDPDRAMF